MKEAHRLFLIVLFGPPGAGKTTLADALKAELKNTAHIGVDHIKRFISEFRETPSHQVISKKVINAMSEEYLNNGINVIVEQGMSGDEIRNLEKIAKDHEADFFVYGLNADSSILKDRVFERSTKANKPLVPQHEIEEHTKVYYANDYLSTVFIDTGKFDEKERMEIILKNLGL